MTVSVLLPTKDEAENIVRVIEGVRKASPDYNIIVIDDSVDNHMTRILAITNGAKVIEGQHMGLGQAIIDGIRVSDGDVVVVMDADLSHPPSKLPELVNACRNGYNMSVGSRYIKGGSIVGWTLKRRIISFVASILAYPITHIHDSTSGFFAVRKNIIDGISLQPSSWKIMLEVLVKTGANVVEIPIEFKDREAGKSKFNHKEVYAYLKHLYKLAFYKWRMLPFMIVGFIGYLVNMAVYYPLTLWFKHSVAFLGQEFYLPPFIISSFIAISCNYYMNKRFTFKDCQEKSFGYGKYLATCSTSLPVEMVLIFLFVHFLGIFPVVAVGLAILIVFVARYLVISRIVWRKN